MSQVRADPLREWRAAGAPFATSRSERFHAGSAARIDLRHAQAEAAQADRQCRTRCPTPGLRTPRLRPANSPSTKAGAEGLRARSVDAAAPIGVRPDKQ